MKERILITGANGFIGSRLVESMENAKKEVIKLNHDYLLKPDLLKEVLEEVRPNAIYHLAAYGNNYNQKDLSQIFQANFVGTFNLLFASSDLSYNSFINTGSSSEYGKKDLPMNEAMIPETDTFYGATKVGATYMARAFAKQYELPIVSVRPFSVYGPGEAGHRFIPTIVRSCLAGTEMKLAPGVHDWIYIDDFIEGMTMVASNAKTLAGEVINIGSGVQYTNHEIVKIVENVLGIRCPIEETARLRDFDNTLTWVADNSRLCALGWKPKFDIYTGIKNTINA